MTQNIIQNTTQNPTQNKIPNPTAPLSDHIQQALQSAKQTQDKAFITALGRGMLVLSVFEQQQQLTHQQICDKTQLPKATVSRLIHTLLQLNVLKRDSNDSYQLGKNLLALSNSWPVQDMVEQSIPLLREFAQAHQVSVNIATENEGEMRYLACYRSPARLAVNLTVGSTVPLDKTAIGRAFYVAQTASMQQQMHDSLPYPPASDEQSKALTNLTAATAFFEQHGYTLSDGEYSPDILAVAVPLYDSIEGRYTHSLNASVPRASWEAEDYIDFIVPKLQALARQIEEL